MACSVSRQDKPNPALWLAGWAGKMELSCPLRPVLAVFCTKNFPESHIISTLIPKLIRPRWLDIGLGFFFASLLTSADSVSIHTYNVQSSGLGLEIDRELTFQSHVDRLCIRNHPSALEFLKKIGHCPELKHRVLVYNAIIRPVMDYVSVFLSNYQPSVELFTKLSGFLSQFENA